MPTGETESPGHLPVPCQIWYMFPTLSMPNPLHSCFSLTRCMLSSKAPKAPVVTPPSRSEEVMVTPEPRGKVAGQLCVDVYKFQRSKNRYYLMKVYIYIYIYTYMPIKCTVGKLDYIIGQVVRWFGGCSWSPARFHFHGYRVPTKDGGSQESEVEAAPETWESHAHPCSPEKDESA